MKWQELPDQHCSVARSLAVIGDRWTLLVIRDLFLGATRFDEIQSSLGISRTILTQRLNLLESEGIVTRKVYQSNPTRHAYHLSSKGIDLYPVLVSIVHWGDKHYAGTAGPPVLQHHRTCGHDFQPVLSCSECGGAVSPFETEARPGPGLDRDGRARFAHRADSP